MIGGVKLPPEKYCLTGVGWGLREEWDSEGEDVEVALQQGEGGLDAGEAMRTAEAEGDGDEDAEPTMEDVFGDDGGGAGGGRGGEDEDDDMLDA
ncbi:hypothetical protein GJ744_006470 [Endocarpon pusillum]|uniref:Uncharacterized protein n=1 Tax=Endocarpon pusillum TaxID=364733 RepID=A0A8H7AVD3_9EURO|nr:hypothetical protein GJ744_006470 [Endocarpon pusillum]